MANWIPFNCPLHCNNVFEIERNELTRFNLLVVAEEGKKILTQKAGNPLAIFCVHHLAGHGPSFQNGRVARNVPKSRELQELADVPTGLRFRQRPSAR